MGKKIGGKRLGKKQVNELLQNLFHSNNPNETFSFKTDIQGTQTRHPSTEDAGHRRDGGDGMGRLPAEGERQLLPSEPEDTSAGGGLSTARPVDATGSKLDDGGTPVFVAERNFMSGMDGDRVKGTLHGTPPKHIKEAIVIEIVKRAHDTIVGKLRVEKDIAFLVTADSTIVHDIIIPKRKLKGGKTDDKAVVKIIQWPNREHKNIVGSGDRHPRKDR